MRRMSEWPDSVPHAAHRMNVSAPPLGDSEDVATIVLLLFPSFSLLSLSSFLAPFEKANGILGRQKFRWVFASKSGSFEMSSLGVTMPTDFSFGDIMTTTTSHTQPELVVIVAEGVEQLGDAAELSGPVRRCIRQGVPVVALGTATWLLAEMGALKNTECTIYWEQLAAFSETFRGPNVIDTIFTEDKGIWSCAGETAAFDLGVALLERSIGTFLTADVCKHNIADGVRSRTHRQTSWFPWSACCTRNKLPDAIALMEKNLDEPLSLQRIANTLKISRRQLERLFENYVGITPHRYYMKLRLDRARQLVEATNKPIIDIAMACGFVSASHFTKSYRLQFGRGPQQSRVERISETVQPEKSEISAGRARASRNRVQPRLALAKPIKATSDRAFSKVGIREHSNPR